MIIYNIGLQIDAADASRLSQSVMALIRDKAMNEIERPTRKSWGKRFACCNNILPIYLALSLLKIPDGGNLFMGVHMGLVLVLAGLGIVFGIPLIYRDFNRGCSQIDITIGTVLSFTPLPIFVLLVLLIARAIQFRFI